MKSAGTGDAGLLAHLLGALAERVADYLITRRTALTTRRNIVSLGVLVLCLCSPFAVGQAGGGSGGAAPTGDITGSYGSSLSSSTVVRDISQAVTIELNRIRNSAALGNAGKVITAVLLVLLLFWTTLKTMASGRGISDIFAEWTPIFMAFGVVTLFLDKSVGQLIVSTMDSIGTAIAGTSMGTLDGAIHAGLDPLFRAITAVVTQPSVTLGTEPGWTPTALMSWLAMNIAAVVLSIIAALTTAFLLIVAAVVMAAHIIMGYISVQIALALAPVMVPFLMFKPTAWLFDSWLRFLLGSCMLKIVVAFLMNVIAGLTSAMNTVSARYFAEANKLGATGAFHTDVMMLGLMVIFAMLATLLLTRAPEISAGIMSGSAGGAGFGGLRAISGGLSNRAVGGANSGAVGGLRDTVAGARSGFNTPPRRPPGK